MTKTARTSAFAVLIGLSIVIAGGLSTAAAQTDEVLQQVSEYVPSPSFPIGNDFDMSFVDPTLGLYFLADRTFGAIDVLPTGTTSPSLTQLGRGVFVGVASGGNTSGPNGVITANNSTEVWAGDGPSIDPITGLSTSHVVVIDVASNVATHKIDTGGVMRAGKLCDDPKDKLVLVANDDLQDRFLSFISTSKYNVVGKIALNGLDPNGGFEMATNATNAIGQCQWDSLTGNFYVAVPEVGGSGINSAAGAVLVIDPKHMKVQQVFAVDPSQCRGPQGMAIGPYPQILLGCSGIGGAPYASPLNVTAPGSIVISAIDGSTVFNLPGLNGVDEVWYNSTDNSYYLAANNNTRENLGYQGMQSPFLQPQIAVVDAAPSADQTGQEDQSVLTGPSAHSIAVDPSAKIVYLPFGDNSFPCEGIIGLTCIALFQPFGTDDPGVVVSKK
jgi:hypothetical protein